MSYRHKLSSTLWKSCRPLIIFKRLTHNCYHCHRRNHNWSLRPFYRTMPMHSADYAVARCQFVCLSVCLSVTRRYCDKTAERIITLFPPLRIHTIRFFTPNVMAIFRSGPPTGTSNAGVYEKITIFDQHFALCRKWYKIEPKLQRDINRDFTLLKGVISNNLEWLGEIFSDTKHARPLCNSWASCIK